MAINWTEVIGGLVFVLAALVIFSGVFLIILHHRQRLEDDSKVGKLAKAELEISQDLLKGRVIFHDEKTGKNKDRLFYMKNQHPMVSMITAHRLHPFSREERIVTFGVGICFIFMTSTISQLQASDTCTDCSTLIANSFGSEACNHCLAYPVPFRQETANQLTNCNICLFRAKDNTLNMRCYDVLNPSYYFPEVPNLATEEHAGFVIESSYCKNITYSSLSNAEKWNPAYKSPTYQALNPIQTSNSTMCWAGLNTSTYNATYGVGVEDPYKACVKAFNPGYQFASSILFGIVLFFFQELLALANTMPCSQSEKISSRQKAALECLGHYFVSLCGIVGICCTLFGLYILTIRNANVYATIENFFISQGSSIVTCIPLILLQFEYSYWNELKERRRERKKAADNGESYKEPRSLDEMEAACNELAVLSNDPYLLRSSKRKSKSRRGSSRPSSATFNRSTHVEMQAFTSSATSDDIQTLELRKVDKVDLEKDPAGVLIQSLFHSHETLGLYPLLKEGQQRDRSIRLSTNSDQLTPEVQAQLALFKKEAAVLAPSDEKSTVKIFTERSLIKIRVIRAYKLPKADLNIPVNPYVLVTFGTNKIGKTKVQNSTSDPEWNDQFTIGPLGVKNTTLVNFIVYDNTLLGHHALGRVQMSVRTIKQNGSFKNRGFPLVDYAKSHIKASGFLVLSISDATSGDDGAEEAEAAAAAAEAEASNRTKIERAIKSGMEKLGTAANTVSDAIHDIDINPEDAEEQEAEGEGSSSRVINDIPFGSVILLAGPSGSGKSSLIHMLLKDYPERFVFGVTHTTRAPRDGEVDGVDYYFVEKDKMLKEIEEKKFIEYAEVHGNLYGTSVKVVESIIFDQKKVCLMDVDVNGCESFLKSKYNPLLICISPPSIENLRQRLEKRGEKAESIAKRLDTAKTEIEYIQLHSDLFNISIVNDDLDRAYSELCKNLQDHVPTLQLPRKKVTPTSKIQKSSPIGMSFGDIVAAASIAAATSAASSSSSSSTVQATPSPATLENDNTVDDDEAEKKAKEESEKKAKEETDRKVKEEAEKKLKEEAEKKKVKEEAEKKAKEEAEKKAKEEAEKKAKEEAEKKAKEEAEKKAKEESEKKAKEEAEKKAKEEAEKKAKEESEKKAKEEEVDVVAAATIAEKVKEEEKQKKAEEEKRAAEKQKEDEELKVKNAELKKKEEDDAVMAAIASLAKAKEDQEKKFQAEEENEQQEQKQVQKPVIAIEEPIIAILKAKEHLRRAEAGLNEEGSPIGSEEDMLTAIKIAKEELVAAETKAREKGFAVNDEEAVAAIGKAKEQLRRAESSVNENGETLSADVVSAAILQAKEQLRRAEAIQIGSSVWKNQQNESADATILKRKEDLRHVEVEAKQNLGVEQIPEEEVRKMTVQDKIKKMENIAKHSSSTRIDSHNVSSTTGNPIISIVSSTTTSLPFSSVLTPTVSLLLLKPNCYQFKNVVTNVVKDQGFKIIAEHETILDSSTIESLFPDKVSQVEFQDIISNLTSGKSVVMCLERIDAVERLLSLVGPSDLLEAKEKDQFSLRALLTSNNNNNNNNNENGENGVHVSTSLQTAVREVKLFFPDLIQKGLVIIKPDVTIDVREKIMRRLNQNGFRIYLEKDTLLNDNQAKMICENENDGVVSDVDFDLYQKYITSGNVYVLCVERYQCITSLKAICGPTNPIAARQNFPQSIRAIFGGVDIIHNGVYASSNEGNVVKEIESIML